MAAASQYSAVVYDDGYKRDGVKYFLVSASGPQGPNGGAWQVRRRYNEFQRLHDELARHRVVLPAMPPKSFFRARFSGGFQEDRRRQLEYILQAALQSDPSLLMLQELRTFLGLMPGAAIAASAPSTGPVMAQAAPVVAQAVPVQQATAPPAQVAPQPISVYAQPTPVYAQPPAVHAQPAAVYSQPAPAYGVAPPVYMAPPIYDTPSYHHSHHSHHSGHVAAAAVGGGVAGLVGGMMLENALEHRHRDRYIEEVRPGIFGTETLIEQSRPHGFFGSEQVVEDVRTDMFGDTEIRREVIDRDMFGRVTDVREEVIDRDMFGNVTEYSYEAW